MHESFSIPLELTTDRFRLEPLGIQHNERDHLAWMSSIDHISNTPGFNDDRWPVEMPLEKNLVDIKRHVEDFALRKGFTYTVMDGDEIIGAVYIYPSKEDTYEARVKSWVVATRPELDFVLWKTVSNWLKDVWPFDSVQYKSR